MPAFYIASEASIPYTFVSPTGVRAVLNDPTDPDFCGYLDGEEALTGIDSPEVRDSFAEYAENDGALAGTNWRGRRPITMSGRVIPTSAADRNLKLGKLEAATAAFSADGTLTWTPSGGEPVFLKFRRQLPFRTKGGFNKEFQIGLVANDPRIYTQRAYTSYSETNGNTSTVDFRRFTWASGSNTLIASRSLYLPPGTWTVKVPVKSSVASRTVTLGLGSGTGTSTPLSLSTGWQTVSQTLTTTNAATVATDLTVTLSSALTSGQWIEVGDPFLESAAGLFPAANATFAQNWVTNANHTMTFVTASPPSGLVYNPGNAATPMRQRIIGPLSNTYAALTSGSSQVGLQPSSAYSGSDYAVIDYGLKTVYKNNTTSDYGSVDPVYTYWNGLPPDVNLAAYIISYGGATTATRLETTWRGAWL